MPSTTAMRKGFNLRPGERIGAEIAACDMGHETLKKNQTYEYPCKIQFKGKDTNKVKASWMRNIGTKPRIIHSEYGSPYECYFQEPSVRKGQNDAIVMTVKAVANRRRDIPTLREVAQTQSPPEPHEEIEALKKDDYKVVRSHWATSKCGTCRDKILPGQMIARKELRKRADSDRGWSHVHCLASEMKIGKKKRASTTKKQAGTANKETNVTKRKLSVAKKRGRPTKEEEDTARKRTRKRSASAAPKATAAKTNGTLSRGRKRKPITAQETAQRGRKRKATESDQADDVKKPTKNKVDQVQNHASGGNVAQSNGDQQVGIAQDTDGKKLRAKSTGQQ